MHSIKTCKGITEVSLKDLGGMKNRLMAGGGAIL